MTKYILSSQDIINIKNLVNQINVNPQENNELFISQSKKLSNELPLNIKEVLSEFVNKGSETGFLLLSNVIFDEYIPNTPPDNSYFIGEKTFLAKAIAIFNQYLGDMIAYEAEGFGRLFQDMVPNKSLSKTQTSLGSKVELEIHTEQAFSKLKPDILTLGCLRGDENAVTYILPVKLILDKLDDEQKRLLRESLWLIGVDLSFQMNVDEFIDGDTRGPISIIQGSEEDPQLIFDQDLMYGTTIEADDLKNVITKIYYESRLSHVLKPGDIIFIDNRRAVHGRSPFSPKYDGSDRFIIRSFVTFDYEYSSYARPNNKRAIEAKYS